MKVYSILGLNSNDDRVVGVKEVKLEIKNHFMYRFLELALIRPSLNGMWFNHLSERDKDFL